MGIVEFEQKLNELIADGCTQISAQYQQDTPRSVLYDGCDVSGTAEQYLKISIEDPNGCVVANFGKFPKMDFRVSDNPNELDVHVWDVVKDGTAAIIKLK